MCASSSYVLKVNNDFSIVLQQIFEGAFAVVAKLELPKNTAGKTHTSNAPKLVRGREEGEWAVEQLRRHDHTGTTFATFPFAPFALSSLSADSSRLFLHHTISDHRQTAVHKLFPPIRASAVNSGYLMQIASTRELTAENIASLDYYFSQDAVLQDINSLSALTSASPSHRWHLLLAQRGTRYDLSFLTHHPSSLPSINYIVLLLILLQLFSPSVL